MADTEDSREKKRAYLRAWKATNQGKVRAYRAAEREKRQQARPHKVEVSPEQKRERRNALSRARYAADPEKFRARGREWMASWRKTVPDANAAKQRKWRAENLARSSFLTQRGDAKRRGIPFLLTFEEWLAIWIESGKLDQRGKFAGQYVMARYGDIGPYATGNVRICSFGDNVREAKCGRIVNDETRKKNSAAQKRNPKPRDNSSGRFVARRIDSSHGTNDF